MRSDPVHFLKVLLPLVVLIVLARLGWVYYDRSHPAPAPRRPVAGIPKELDTLELKILNFYAAEQPVRGQPFSLCYGVINATRVEMTPSFDDTPPVLTRCVQATLGRETELTLRAYGRNGEEATASFFTNVAEPRPEFIFVAISSREFKRGDTWTICYGVKNATRVWLEPGPQPLGVGDKLCALLSPAATPRRILAESKGGREVITLPVRERP